MNFPFPRKRSGTGKRNTIGTEKERFLETKTALHEDLYALARGLVKSVKEDIDAGKKVDPGRLYATTNILGKLNLAKNYEDDIRDDEAEQNRKPKGLSEESANLIKDLLMGKVSA